MHAGMLYTHILHICMYIIYKDMDIDLKAIIFPDEGCMAPGVTCHLPWHSHSFHFAVFA